MLDGNEMSVKSFEKEGKSISLTRLNRMSKGEIP